MAELERLRQGVPIGLTEDGRKIYPHPQFILFWQEFCNQLEAIPAIAAGLEEQIVAVEAATVAAQEAADNANAAAEASTSEQSILASFPTNPSPAPLISADSAGVVTIADHQRQYGDPTLNPTVNVDGDTIATTELNPSVIRVFYSDPTRAGGAVTYQFTVDPADPPVQGGDTHVVGAVTVPAAGTQSGNGVRPPGYVEP